METSRNFTETTLNIKSEKIDLIKFVETLPKNQIIKNIDFEKAFYSYLIETYNLKPYYKNIDDIIVNETNYNKRGISFKKIFTNKKLLFIQNMLIYRNFFSKEINIKVKNLNLVKNYNTSFYQVKTV